MSTNNPNPEESMGMLDTLYQQVVGGVSQFSPPVKQMAREYLARRIEPSDAARLMIRDQIIKCTSSGALTGLGGLATLPLTVPLNVSTVLYFQMRMVACAACIAGLDPREEAVKTMVLACFADLPLTDVVRDGTAKVTSGQIGEKAGDEVILSFMKKLPTSSLKTINQMVAVQFAEQTAKMGVKNAGKLIPGLGAVIGGSFDYVSAKGMGERAYHWFFENDLSIDG